MKNIGWIFFLFLSFSLFAQDAKYDNYRESLEKELEAFGEFEMINPDALKIENYRGSVNGGAEAGESSHVKVEHDLFSKALQLSCKKAAPNAWDVGIKSPKSSINIEVNDVLMAVFYVRCLESDNTGLGKIKAYIEQTPEWASYGVWEGEFDQNWRRVTIIGKVDKELKDNKLWLSVHAGDRRQLLQFGAFTIYKIKNQQNNLDVKALKRKVAEPMYYKGMEADAVWRQEANVRINKHRKTDVSLEIISATGKSVKNASIHLKQDKHEFGFGTFLGGIDKQDQKLNSEMDTYLSKSKQYFNKFTIPMYWAHWSTWGWPEKNFESKYELGLDWACRSGYDVRGHVTVWPSYKYMPFLEDLNNDGKKVDNAINDHLEFVLKHPNVNGKMSDWDIINEVYANHDIIDIQDKKEEIIVDWFAKAQSLDTVPNFYINDYGILNQDLQHQEAYFDLLKLLENAEAPIDGIGMQGHLNGPVPPETLLQTLDKYSVFDKNIQITELDFYSDFPEDDAKYMEDLLTTFFSHPKVNAIIVWGFYQPFKSNWRPEFYFFDKDFNESPIAKSWKNMTQEVWHNDTVIQSSNKGMAVANVFKGQYQCKLSMSGKEANLALNVGDESNQFKIDESLIDWSDETNIMEQALEVSFSVPSMGYYQLGSSAKLVGDFPDWYTLNLNVQVDNNALGIVYIDGKKEYVAGLAKQTVYLEKGEHNINITWNKFEGFDEGISALYLKNTYLVKVK